MRNIKFREWDGFQMNYEPMVSLISTASLNDRFDINTELDINTVLLQFTGAQDCNQLDIYEGDILKITNINYETHEEIIKMGVVRWNKERCSFYISGLEYDTIFPNKNWEIVGNIYQNSLKKLLENAR